MATTGKAKKVASTVAAVAAAAALMLGGTLAWQSTNQTALNEASDVINPGGRLHDDFYIDANGDYNADIYVENFDKEDIFARVQLQEYMEVIMNYGTAGEKNYLVLGEQDEAMDGSSINIRTREIDENTTEQLYEREYATHSAYAPDSSVEQAGADYRDAADPANYWEWTMGSPDSETVYYMPTFNKNKDSLVADRNGMYVDRIGGISNWGPQQYDDVSIYTATSTEDGTEIWDADINDVDEVGYLIHEDLTQYIDDKNITTVEATHTAKAVGKTNGFISMTEWLKLKDANADTDNYWVYDDTDENGWIYWSSPIKPDTATGLLLDSIELKGIMDDTWYYAINVIAQFVTADDVGKSDGTGFYDTEKGSAPTADAEEFLEDIGVNVSGEAGDDPSVTTDFAVKVTESATGNSWTIKNGSLELTPSEETGYSLSLVSDSYTADDFTWEITDITADSSSLNPNEDGTYYLNFPADGDNGTYVVVTVTNIEDASKAATLKVTLDQDDAIDDPEPDADETDPIVLSVKAEPDWYIPNASNNSIALTAELTDNGTPVDDMDGSAVEWSISAAARAALGEYTQLTDNGDGTATLAIDPSEQNNVLVSASYTHTDGKERTGEILITNGPRLATMWAYDLDTRDFVSSIDFLPDGGTYNLKIYFFPNYTGTVQPVEAAYTGDAANILASRLSVYACESIDDHVQIPDPDGVTIEQDENDPSLVTVTIDPGVSESFHILFDVENGMQMPFSFDVPTPELVWTGASQQDPDSPVHLAPSESATYQLINVSASCAEADILYTVWSGNAADPGNFSIARDANDARIVTITHGCADEDSCTCYEDYYFVSAGNIPGIADGIVSPNAISISTIDYVIYDHTFDSYHYSANGVPSTLTEGDYTVYLTSGKDMRYTGNGASFDWSSYDIPITDNAVAGIPDEEGAYYVTAGFTLDSSIPTGVYYINATNNAGESWSIPIEWNNPADDTLYSLYAWAVDENGSSTDTYTQGGEPAVYIKANVWDDDVSDYVYDLTEYSITWTIEGDSSNTAYMSFVEVDEDGSYIAKLNPRDAQEAITITAAYTAPDGSELTAPVNLNVIFKASDYLTLDGENTSQVHPANQYNMVYTDADGETGYTFEITEDSGVAEISGNVLTIVGDAPEFAKIAIAVKNADGDIVDTIDLSVSHHITFKSVYEGETTILINGSPTNVYAGADYTAWLGNDVQLALGIPSQPEGNGPITPDLFEDYGVVPEYRDGDENGDIIRYTFNQSGISVLITGTYTYGDDFIIEDDSAVDILWAYSVGIEYSLADGERTPYDGTTLFLEDGDTLTLYATSYYMDGSESDPQPSEFSWFIGERGNNPSTNETAFGSLTDGFAPDGASYSVVSVNDMEEDLSYYIRVAADLHNSETVRIIKGAPAIDGPTEVEVDSYTDYGTNTLRDYTFSIDAPEEYAYFEGWGYLVVTPEAEAVIGQTYTITATPDGHDGPVLTMPVTIVAADQSNAVMLVDDYEASEEYYGGDYDTAFTLSADITDRDGNEVEADQLAWTAVDNDTDDDITDTVLSNNGDGTYRLDLSGQTGTICVRVENLSENAGNDSYAECTFYYEGEAVSPLSHLDMYYNGGTYEPSRNSFGEFVPIISTARDSAVYLTPYDENWEDYTGPIVWSCEPAGYVDEGGLALGVVALTNDSFEMSSSVVELTITATDEQGNTADFIVLLYHSGTHELVDTLSRYSGGESGYYHVFHAVDADENDFCVIRNGRPLPYFMLELTYDGGLTLEDYRYSICETLCSAYDSFAMDPSVTQHGDVKYVGVCGHPTGANNNYPQEEEPLFSVSNTTKGNILASAVKDGSYVYGAYAGDSIQVTSTRLADGWTVSPEGSNQSSSADNTRARLFFTVPEDAAIGSEITVTQTDGDESYSITLVVADPGPLFDVSLNGTEVITDAPANANEWPTLSLAGLSGDAEIVVTSTYPTDDGTWEVTNYTNTFDVAIIDGYSCSFTIPADKVQSVVDTTLSISQPTDNGWWYLYLRVTGEGSNTQQPESLTAVLNGNVEVYKGKSYLLDQLTDEAGAGITISAVSINEAEEAALPTTITTDDSGRYVLNVGAEETHDNLTLSITYTAESGETGTATLTLTIADKNEDSTAPTIAITSTANQYPEGGDLVVTLTAAVTDSEGSDVTLNNGDITWTATDADGDTVECITVTAANTALLETENQTGDITVTAAYGEYSESITITAVPNETGEPSFSVAYVDGEVFSSYDPGSTVTVNPGAEILLYSTNNSLDWKEASGQYGAESGYSDTSGATGSYYHVTVPALADAGSDITVTQTVDGEEYSIVLRLEGAPVFVDEEGNELASVVNVTPGQVITFRTANALTNSDYSITPDNGALTAEQIDSTFFRWIVTIPSDAETGDSYIFNCIAQPNGSNSRYDVLVTFVVE